MQNDFANTLWASLPLDKLRLLATERGLSDADASAMPRIRYVRQLYLTESVYKIVVQKSIPAQIRQLTLYMSNNKG